MFRVKSNKSDWFQSHSIVFAKPITTGISLDCPEVVILGADKKEPRLWGQK